MTREKADVSHLMFVAQRAKESWKQETIYQMDSKPRFGASLLCAQRRRSSNSGGWGKLGAWWISMQIRKETRYVHLKQRAAICIILLFIPKCGVKFQREENKK